MESGPTVIDIGDEIEYILDSPSSSQPDEEDHVCPKMEDEKPMRPYYRQQLMVLVEKSKHTGDSTFYANRDTEFKKQWAHFRKHVLPQKLLNYFLPGIPNFPSGKGPVVVVDSEQTADKPVLQLRPKQLSKDGFVTGTFISEKELIDSVKKERSEFHSMKKP
ncbi:DgyrCDS9610 [Dimorphilus gyrociliatus]|uniref:DgyrCDS9610 n=1 Tax=Dimorphilus gyrociliatus TaxID=2664684 RepID=A0A7I8VXI4_9ANNE|nr:DgyrCDS9610 [Dimorphilus gyrociliatus]